MHRTFNTIEDPDKVERDHSVSSTINKMPEDIRDRFKALKSLADECSELDDEMQTEMRKLEVYYEQLYQEVDDARAKVISGICDPNDDLIDQFDMR